MRERMSVFSRQCDS